jgi:hypothetical protein
MPSKDDVELAHELLFGAPNSSQRTFPTGGREKAARAALARVMTAEAPDGFFTQAMAALISPPEQRGRVAHVIPKREIIFRRHRGTPVVKSRRREIEIAAFMHEHLEKQKRQQNGTDAQARNLKRAVGAAHDKFGVGRSTIIKIWSEFKPKRRSPTK